MQDVAARNGITATASSFQPGSKQARAAFDAVCSMRLQKCTTAKAACLWCAVCEQKLVKLWLSVAAANTKYVQVNPHSAEGWTNSTVCVWLGAEKLHAPTKQQL
jgi:hypothetical protein